MDKGQVKVIGITGTNGAGKGTVVEYLVSKKAFKHFSVTELITEEIMRRNMPVNRDSLIVVANEVRAQKGPACFVEELLARAKMSKSSAIIESIRTLGELRVIKRNGGIMLAVDADQKLRYERNKARGGVKDGVSFEDFVRQETTEMESTDPNKQNLKACMKEADYVIQNDGTIEELNEKIEKILSIINQK